MLPISRDDLWQAWERVRENEGWAEADEVNGRANGWVPTPPAFETGLHPRRAALMIRWTISPAAQMMSLNDDFR
jgi:hypothetical protein